MGQNDNRFGSTIHTMTSEKARYENKRMMKRQKKIQEAKKQYQEVLGKWTPEYTIIRRTESPEET